MLFFGYKWVEQGDICRVIKGNMSSYKLVSFSATYVKDGVEGQEHSIIHISSDSDEVVRVKLDENEVEVKELIDVIDDFIAKGKPFPENINIA
jgi:hypothetical protein